MSLMSHFIPPIECDYLRRTHNDLPLYPFPATSVNSNTWTSMQSAAEETSWPAWEESCATPPYLNRYLSLENTPKKTVIPRKKHSKSRRGCTMCKKRHIRCDEETPTCRNCAKHQSVCEYPEAHYEASSSSKPSSAKSSGKSAQESAASQADEPSGEAATSETYGLVREHRSLDLRPRGLDSYWSSAVSMPAADRENLGFCELVLLSVNIS